MNEILNEKHQDNLTMYVNDVLGLERDIVNALEGQLEDDRVKARGDLHAVLQVMAAESRSRLEAMKELSDSEGGSTGAAIKEAVMGVAGALAGVYGKLREHPVSRIVRDDRVAMNVTETSYAMLYTLALGIGHGRCAQLAVNGLNEAAASVLKLTDLLPGVILDELAKDAPLENPSAEQAVIEVIHQAWRA